MCANPAWDFHSINMRQLSRTQIHSTHAFSAVWNAGLHFLNSLHLYHSKHLDNEVHPCLADEAVIWGKHGCNSTSMFL